MKFKIIESDLPTKSPHLHDSFDFIHYRNNPYDPKYTEFNKELAEYGITPERFIYAFRPDTEEEEKIFKKIINQFIQI